MASVAVSEASGGWKQTVSSLRSRLSTTVPALALFSAAPPATETEEAEGRMRERVRSFGSDMRRLRSKSCERVFQRCRRGWSAVTLATAGTAEREEPGESFSNTATLRLLSQLYSYENKLCNSDSLGGSGPARRGRAGAATR